MESKQDLLNEYCEITRELEKIRNKVAVLRDFTGEQMTNAKSEKEKDIIFLRFKKELKKIEQDPNMKKKYKTLKKNQIEIRNKILQFDEEIKSPINNNKSSNILNNKLSSLINKYKGDNTESKESKESKDIYEINKERNKSTHNIILPKKIESTKITKLYGLIDTLKMDLNK